MTLSDHARLRGMKAPPRALLLLWVGACSGLGLAIVSLAAPSKAPPRTELPPGAVARVDGELVLKTDYDAALRAFAESSQRAPSVADKREVLAKLVNDELMIGHALALGMARADQATRVALLEAMLAAERAAAAAETPSPEQLERYYQRIRPELVRPGPVRVRMLEIQIASRADEPGARARAEQAVARLREGEPFDRVREELGDPADPNHVALLPDEPLAFDTLAERLGPISAEAVRKLAPGGVTDVLGSGALLRVFQLVERSPDTIPPLEEIADEVLGRYREHVQNAALASKLESLRRAADVRLLEPPP